MSSKQPQPTTTTTPRVQPASLLQRKPSHHPTSFSPSPSRNGVTQQDNPHGGGKGRGEGATTSRASVSPTSELSAQITLQPKRTVNALSDMYEQDADQVMRMPEVSSNRHSLMTHTGAGIRRKATKSPKPKSNKGTKKTPTNNLENMELVIDEIRNSGITDNAAVANILANVEAESHFTPQSESLKYRPETLAKSFPKYVKSLDDAKELKAGGEEAIGNRLYGGRMGNAADEGYKFRGRGLIQTTGRDTYESLGKAIGDQELAEHPDKVNDPAVAAKIVPQFFLKYKKLKTKDLSNIDKVNKAVGFHDDPKTHAEAGRRKERAKYFLDQLNQRNADHGKSTSVPTQPATTSVPGSLQPKLTVNSPGDKYEQEADRVADMVMRMPDPMVSRTAVGAVPFSASDGKKKRVQRQCATCAAKGHTSEDCSECKKKKQGLGGTLQRLSTQGDSAAGMAAPPIVSRVLSSPGSALPTDTRTFMESRFGTDFSHVRVHTDSLASESAAAVNARAYTVGSNIVFGMGQSPINDRSLLAHELTHVVQQGFHRFSGNTPLLQRKVSRCCREVQTGESLLDTMSSTLGLKHCFLRTDTKSAGMGPAKDGPLPVNPLGIDTKITDHASENGECEIILNVDERCINEHLQIGHPTGKWMPWNNCNTFADAIIKECSSPPRCKPEYLGGGDVLGEDCIVRPGFGGPKI